MNDPLRGNQQLNDGRGRHVHRGQFQPSPITERCGDCPCCRRSRPRSFRERAARPGELASAPPIKAGSNTAFPSLRQVDAGLLNVGYAEAGPVDGPAVILLHGWPYDIHSFVDVAPLLASAGYRVSSPICGATAPPASFPAKPSAMASNRPCRRRCCLDGCSPD